MCIVAVGCESYALETVVNLGAFACKVKSEFGVYMVFPN